MWGYYVVRGCQMRGKKGLGKQTGLQWRLFYFSAFYCPHCLFVACALTQVPYAFFVHILPASCPHLLAMCCHQCMCFQPFYRGQQCYFTSLMCGIECLPCQPLHTAGRKRWLRGWTKEAIKGHYIPYNWKYGIVSAHSALQESKVPANWSPDR